MTEFQKFWRTLKNHPGLIPVCTCNLAGFVAGATRQAEPSGFAGGMMGLAVTCIFWVPVLITAWKYRN